MNRILTNIQNEPILVTTLVGAGAVLLVQLGFDVPKSLANAISGVIVATAALFGRSRVSPSVEH